MRDARDAEDKRLRDEGEIELLLGGYVETIEGRCVAKLGPVAGLDAAQVVCETLWKALKSGALEHNPWPFRVIVHKRIEFTCRGWYEHGWGESELIEIDGPTGGEADDVVALLDLEAFVAALPLGDREVARLAWLEGLEAPQIAEQLAKTPNAVHQAAHRNKKKLLAWLEAAA
jgi:DNA-directed RNA polymerase specialized sigma24 family protein